ncbi:type II toxin-antitoxin system VapC family toxin [Epibacterium sp. Ofav1-8]|uniref:type II toxin-antitoxin system VapC family toxin n=1 Tax=Epibacterium sp. Ofav1-8 TaxID=2917735 RepID=UPI001EF49F1A|nr:type II toxin-antitoxin system VapC family toxin [Epibacterium sp. Ofav1-8]MCG7625934.1 type II toxin-antitoxin system VapC family toxin [Epibacterium sp. Ofav1-8]
MIILDTNVISELQKPSPNPKVVEWLNDEEPTNLYLTSVTVAELMFGAFSLPEGKRATGLQNAVVEIIEDEFRDRILVFDSKAAQVYGRRMAECRRQGKAVGVPDGQIAAIVIANNMAQVATRDVGPFEAMGVKVINPFVCPSAGFGKAHG